VLDVERWAELRREHLSAGPGSGTSCSVSRHRCGMDGRPHRYYSPASRPVRGATHSLKRCRSTAG
jgi:hypothetical protein